MRERKVGHVLKEEQVKQLFPIKGTWIQLYYNWVRGMGCRLCGSSCDDMGPGLERLRVLGKAWRSISSTSAWNINGGIVTKFLFTFHRRFCSKLELHSYLHSQHLVSRSGERLDTWVELSGQTDDDGSWSKTEIINPNLYPLLLIVGEWNGRISLSTWPQDCFSGGRFCCLDCARTLGCDVVEQGAKNRGPSTL